MSQNRPLSGTALGFFTQCSRLFVVGSNGLPTATINQDELNRLKKAHGLEAITTFRNLYQSSTRVLDCIPPSYNTVNGARQFRDLNSDNHIHYGPLFNRLNRLFEYNKWSADEKAFYEENKASIVGGLVTYFQQAGLLPSAEHTFEDLFIKSGIVSPVQAAEAVPVSELTTPFLVTETAQALMPAYTGEQGVSVRTNWSIVNTVGSYDDVERTQVHSTYLAQQCFTGLDGDVARGRNTVVRVFSNDAQSAALMTFFDWTEAIRNPNFPRLVETGFLKPNMEGPLLEYMMVDPAQGNQELNFPDITNPDWTRDFLFYLKGLPDKFYIEAILDCIRAHEKLNFDNKEMTVEKVAILGRLKEELQSMRISFGSSSDELSVQNRDKTQRSDDIRILQAIGILPESLQTFADFFEKKFSARKTLAFSRGLEDGQVEKIPLYLSTQRNFYVRRQDQSGKFVNVVSDWRIVETLGEGAFGATYIIADIFGHEKVLKIVKPDCPMDMTVDEMNHMSEAAVSRKEQFARPMEIGYAPGKDGKYIHFLIMDRMPGQPLNYKKPPLQFKDMLFYEDGKPNPAMAVFLKAAESFAEALKSLSDMGIVHSDLKPDNVIYDEDTGRCFPIDLGISLRTDTPVDKVRTTLRWAAREALLERKIHPKEDMYSFGVFLFRFIFKQFAFEVSGDINNQVRQVYRGTQQPLPTELLQKLPIPMRQLIEGCLSSDPETRLSPNQVLFILRTFQAQNRWYQLQKGLSGSSFIPGVAQFEINNIVSDLQALIKPYRDDPAMKRRMVMFLNEIEVFCEDKKIRAPQSVGRLKESCLIKSE